MTDLASIDVALGRLLRRLSMPHVSSPVQGDIVAHTGALLSAERSQGNSCLDLKQFAGIRFTQSEESIAMPPVEDWRALLLTSGVCDEGNGVSPLLLDGTRLYLRRFHDAERRVAAAVRARLDADTDRVPAPDASTVAFFRHLFPRTSDDVDWQAVAAAAALRSPLLFVTGGPGTGKTTVAARILALLLHRDPALRIALAAPTGRAATRLAEAIAGATASMSLPLQLREQLPTKGSTLHRLLGYRPWDDCFRHGAKNRLSHDVIVVDEASMVDLLMMDALFAALKPTARIIVLGDPDQLASVETGFVLGDVYAAAQNGGETHGVELANLYASLAAVAMPSSPNATPLRDAVVRLRRSYRFERQQGIGQLASAIQRQDTETALAVLDDDQYPDVSLRAPGQGTPDLLRPLLPFIDAFLTSATPADSLNALSRFRVLCALRDGEWGVTGLNAAIERWLQSRGRRTRGWYDFRPVLITANDPATGLYNGDVGVTRVIDGNATVFFASGETGTKGYSPSRLPAHETAWAMTVHKAQGSEFDHVVFVCPDTDSRVLTRELLYTGVTRGRQTVTVVGTKGMLELALARGVARATGLVDRLFVGK